MIGTVSKKFVAGLLIFAFISIILLALQFIKSPSKELFTNEGQGQAPTRTSDCNCLPGYVAAKKSDMTYFCQNLNDSSKTRNCY